MSELKESKYFDNWNNVRDTHATIGGETSNYVARERGRFFKFIPQWAVVEFLALIIALIISVDALILGRIYNFEMYYVFLVPLIASLIGIVFMIGKRP